MNLLKYLPFMVGMLTFSCGSSAYNSLDTQQQTTTKHFRVISAEKTNWIGGRAGVRGTNYKLTIKRSTTALLNFNSLYDNGHLLKVSQKTANGYIYLTAAYNENPEPNFGDLPAEQSSKSAAKPWLSYTLGTSKSSLKVTLPTIKEIQTANQINTYPKKVN